MIGGGMASSTATEYGNAYVIRMCRRCGIDKNFCMCWVDFINTLNRSLALVLKLEIYKCLKIKKKIILVINLIRRTPTSISGMRGIALLKREDKR